MGGRVGGESAKEAKESVTREVGGKSGTWEPVQSEFQGAADDPPCQLLLTDQKDWTVNWQLGLATWRSLVVWTRAESVGSLGRKLYWNTFQRDAGGEEMETTL